MLAIGYALLASQIELQRPDISLLQRIWHILSNLVLVPLISIPGAVATTVICQCAYTFITMRKASEYAPYHIPWHCLAHYTPLAALMALGLKGLLHYYLSSPPFSSSVSLASLPWLTGGL